MWKVILIATLLVVPDARDHREDPDRSRPIHEAQNEADRGTGRVVDDATYEIERMEQRNQGRRTTEEILADEDRRERIERSERDKESSTQRSIPLEQRRVTPRALGGEFAPDDVRGGERLEVMSDVLAALDERDRLVREAQQQLAADPQKLKRRELELLDEFAQRLAHILGSYELKRVVAPSTQPAKPQAATQPVKQGATDPLRVPVQVEVPRSGAR